MSIELNGKTYRSRKTRHAIRDKLNEIMMSNKKKDELNKMIDGLKNFINGGLISCIESTLCESKQKGAKKRLSNEEVKANKKKHNDSEINKQKRREYSKMYRDKKKAEKTEPTESAVPAE